jgi:hypothetical protein
MQESDLNAGEDWSRLSVAMGGLDERIFSGLERWKEAAKHVAEEVTMVSAGDVQLFPHVKWTPHIVVFHTWHVDLWRGAKIAPMHLVYWSDVLRPSNKSESASLMFQGQKYLQDCKADGQLASTYTANGQHLQCTRIRNRLLTAALVVFPCRGGGTYAV